MPDVDALALLDGLRLVLTALDKGDLTPDEALAAVKDELAPPTEIPAAPPSPAPVLTVEDLLAQSRAAHLRYRQAHDAKDLQGQQIAIAEALTLRQSAVALNPALTDPAWREPGKFDHTALMPFYLAQVGGV